MGPGTLVFGQFDIKTSCHRENDGGLTYCRSRPIRQKIASFEGRANQRTVHTQDGLCLLQGLDALLNCLLPDWTFSPQLHMDRPCRQIGGCGELHIAVLPRSADFVSVGNKRGPCLYSKLHSVVQYAVAPRHTWCTREECCEALLAYCSVAQVCCFCWRWQQTRTMSVQ